jgi:predicted nuclease with TOPRIM domain
MKNSINDEIKTFYDKIEQVKIENGKYNYNLINQCKELKTECEEFPKIKQDLQNKLDEFNKINEHTNHHMEFVKSEFELFKTKYNELSEFIKVNKTFLMIIIGC